MTNGGEVGDCHDDVDARGEDNVQHYPYNLLKQAFPLVSVKRKVPPQE